jgi:hypothetical protein
MSAMRDGHHSNPSPRSIDGIDNPETPDAESPESPALEILEEVDSWLLGDRADGGLGV